MDRIAPLNDMAYRLSQAAVERDWDELARADAELAVLLPRLSGRGRWSELEQLALSELRKAHHAALECCLEASTELDARLADLCANKEAWQAYSMNADWQEQQA